MTRPDTHPPVAAWIALMRAGTAVESRIEHDLKQAGLPPLGWYDVLLELDRAESGALRQRDISQRMLLTRYNVSRLADRLENAGLVERATCPEDGRGGVVRITASGRKTRARMWKVYAAAIDAHVGARLTDGEAKALAASLGKLV